MGGSFVAQGDSPNFKRRKEAKAQLNNVGSPTLPLTLPHKWPSQKPTFPQKKNLPIQNLTKKIAPKSNPRPNREAEGRAKGRLGAKKTVRRRRGYLCAQEEGKTLSRWGGFPAGKFGGGGKGLFVQGGIQGQGFVIKRGGLFH